MQSDGDTVSCTTDKTSEAAGQDDEAVARELLVAEAQQLAAEREAYLASERLAKQLEEESAERELNPPGGHDEAASLELARLLDNEERVRHARTP